MKYIFNHKRIAGWLMTAALLLLAASCKEDDDKAVAGFTIDQNEVQFVNNGGTVELKIATNEAWTAETDADWCMVSPANGDGSGICVIKADSSYLYKSRIGKVRFYSENGTKEIMIKQFGYEPIIDFTSSEMTIPSYAAPDEAYVKIEAMGNVPFQVTIPADAQEWLSIEGASTYEPSTTVPRKQVFRVKFKTYTESDRNRVAEVEFNQKSTNGRAAGELLKKKVKIIQEKAPLIIPSRAGDSLAILSIARVFGMGNNNWSTSRPITHWNDVVTEERTYRYKYNGIDKDSTELRVISVRYVMMDTKESIPYQVKFLTELETFIAMGNSNKALKSIDLGSEITSLKKLKSLSLMGYGVKSLPNEMGAMESLEELDLYGNNFLELPQQAIFPLAGKLKFLDLGGNRKVDGVKNLQLDIPRDYTLQTIGLGGELPRWLFMMSALEHLSLSYNYFYGSIPTMDGTTDVMPNLKHFSLNLNRLTGKLPDWLINHKRIACWDPFLLVFNQEGSNHEGKAAVFENAPLKVTDLKHPECPDYKDEEVEIALNLPALSPMDIETKVPLHGHWRYYKMLNNK